MVPGALPQRVKRTGRKAERASPSSVKLRMHFAIPSPPYALTFTFDTFTLHVKILGGFLAKTSTFLCGNKMPTRCNRGFYCRSYCLLNMFRAPLCPSSGAQEYYTMVAPCGISCCASKHSANRTHNPQLHTRSATWKPQHEIPQAATTV